MHGVRQVPRKGQNVGHRVAVLGHGRLNPVYQGRADHHRVGDPGDFGGPFGGLYAKADRDGATSPATASLTPVTPATET